MLALSSFWLSGSASSSDIASTCRSNAIEVALNEKIQVDALCFFFLFFFTYRPRYRSTFETRPARSGVRKGGARMNLPVVSLGNSIEEFSG